jgi:hypothetical protein
MSVRDEYFDLLSHLGSTVTMRELHEDRVRPDASGLRHDIDHDLDLALEVAHHEHRLGIRSTYFLLHTNPYWEHEDLVLRCRQLEAYGHEVGLHLNVIKQWIEGEVDDVDARLRELLATLRDGGIDVVGTSAHGDRACYEHGFINYWIWRELRGDDPETSEHGLSAEGIPVAEEQWRVPYPAAGELRRADDACVPLWSSSLADHGLAYDAVHVPVDHYWTDTGGGWKRSDDPLTADLSRGRHQVLVHPHWWRGPQRIYFIVSTARSGSKWLASYIEKTTSACGRHEWTLNHTKRDGVMVADKRTNTDYVGLVEERDLGARLVQESVADIVRRKTDIVEANVYLEPFVADLVRASAQVEIVHLHRDGREVVRSLLNRGWYDTPGDRKHRAVPIDGWDDLTQLERCCWYYRFTHESIMPFAERSLRLESLVHDRDALHAELESMGLIVHPLLAAEATYGPVNESESWSVRPFDEWPDEARATFARICGPVHDILDYPVPDVSVDTLPADTALGDAARREETEAVYRYEPGRDRSSFGTKNLRSRVVDGDLQLEVKRADRFSYVVFARGNWNRVKQRDGVPSDHWRYNVCRLAADVPADRVARVFALGFDAAGNRVSSDHVATVRADSETTIGAFAAAAGSTHFAIALHMSDHLPGDQVTVHSVQVQSVPMGHRYRAALDASAATTQGVA